MRIASVDNDLGDLKTFPTPQDPKEAIARFAEFARTAGVKIEAAAGGIRGRVVDGVYLKDKVLSRWEGSNLVAEFSNALGAPTQLVHDTAAAGLGEFHFGAGRGSKICAYVTVSTGVGGDRIVEGRIDRYTYNPEIGRQLVDGVELEELVSGTAVQKKFGVHPKDLASEEERNKLADILAIGLYNTILHWSPDTIVLGGSMIIGVNPIPLARVKESLSRRVTMYPLLPSMRIAELGDNAGLNGAMALLNQDGI